MNVFDVKLNPWSLWNSSLEVSGFRVSMACFKADFVSQVLFFNETLQDIAFLANKSNITHI